MLVGAFQVHIGRERQALVCAVLEHAGVRHAGFPPHVEDVLLRDKLGAAALLAVRAVRQVLAGLLGEPGVGALFVEQLDDGVERCLVGHGLAALGALEHGDGHTPAALTRDAPVGTVRHHGADAVDGPAGIEGHIALDGVHGLAAQAVLLHRDEPLVGGAEDDGLMAAPAMRIAVADLARSHERALLAQPIDDDGVGVVGIQTRERAGILGEHAVVVDGHEDGNVELQAHQVVVLAMARGGMDAAGTGVERYMVAVDDLAFKVLADGASIGKAAQLGALEHDGLAVLAAHQGVILPTGDFGDFPDELLGEDDVAAVDLDHDVIGVGHQAHGGVGRKGPRRGGPNEHVRIAGGAGSLEDAGHGVKLELHVNGRGNLVGVFDFSLGKSRMALLAPVDGLATAIHLALEVHIAENLHVAGLEVRDIGQIRVIPVGVDAQALEAIALDADVFGRPLAAQTAQLGLRRFLHLIRAQSDLDHMLDRLAVAVPTRHVRGEVPALGMAFVHEVLQHLVEGVADVDGAVGIRRAIVQDEGLAVLVLLENLFVDVLLLPLLKPFRLGCRQVAPHREIRLREIHGVLVRVRHEIAPSFA